MAHAYVLVDHLDGALTAVTAELITAARALGDPAAVVVGPPGTTDAVAAELAELGAVTIIAAESADYDQRVTLPETDALAALAAAEPGPIVVAAGADGNEIAGRLATRLGAGVLFDVVGINADRTATHSIFGDTHTVSAAVGGDSPIYTLRPGATTAEPIPAAGGRGSIDLPATSALDATVTGFSAAPEQQRPDLAQAKVVVAGGRGVGSAEGFTTIVEPLADVLGAAVGCTRDAVDEKYYDAAYQIGQTGVSVSPDLYIGLGISGAIQHKAGMQTARTIVVINNDEDAAIFDIADLGVVGDLAEIVPALTEELRSRATS